jgi:hypothetical protein
MWLAVLFLIVVAMAANDALAIPVNVVEVGEAF